MTAGNVVMDDREWLNRVTAQTKKKSELAHPLPTLCDKLFFSMNISLI